MKSIFLTFFCALVLLMSGFELQAAATASKPKDKQESGQSGKESSGDSQATSRKISNKSGKESGGDSQATGGKSSNKSGKESGGDSQATSGKSSNKSGSDKVNKKKSYNKILKNGTAQEKLDYAEESYKIKNYKRAITIYEEMLPLMRGRDGLEDMLYRLAYGYYYEGDFFMSGHYFRSLTRQFPNGSNLEEAMYMAAYCKSMESLYFKLDPTPTIEAIKQFQLFVNYYPQSKRVAEANKIIDDMRAKLARKSYELANMYYRRELYNAAAIAYGNFLREYPESVYREDAMYKLVRSRYLYADKSIAARQSERFSKVIEGYEMFFRNFKDSKYVKELSRYRDIASEKLKRG